MSTVTQIRQGFLNANLGIATDAETLPWPIADRDRYIGDALSQCWPDIGLRATGSVATSQASDLYTVPGSIDVDRISRIEIRSSSGGLARKVDRVMDWIPVSATQVRVNPILRTDTTLALHFYGWKPFAVDGSDLPARLDRVIAFRAAGLAYSALAGQLGNLRRQQGLDNPRVVDYPTAVGLAALFERRYFEAIDKDPSRPSLAPRGARR